MSNWNDKNIEAIQAELREEMEKLFQENKKSHEGEYLDEDFSDVEYCAETDDLQAPLILNEIKQMNEIMVKADEFCSKARDVKDNFTVEESRDLGFLISGSTELNVSAVDAILAACFHPKDIVDLNKQQGILPS